MESAKIVSSNQKFNFNKVTKSQVKARLKRLASHPGETLILWLCPSKMFPMPGQPFNMALCVEFHSNGVTIYGDDLEKVINHFAYYNCSAATGNRVHFYTED